MARRFGQTALVAGTVAAVMTVWGLAVSAQDTRWVQVEAHRDLETAIERARELEDRVGTVSGFRLPSAWYALSLGPYENQSDAFAVRRALRAEGAIPVDSFVSTGGDYLEQVYPTGAAMPVPQGVDPVPDALATPDEAPIEDAPETALVLPEPEPERDETPREAQASERALDRDARAELQTALQWFGHYTLTIDAAFGPGTRRAMAAWQEELGHEPTGILTTRQRAELLDGYRSELAALGMEEWVDDRAGVRVELPLAMVEFDRTETPFVHFAERDGSGVQVLLISQSGNQARLFGLYEIMQTLEIVPLEGARERRQNSFLLTGQNDSLRSHTFAQLRNGQIKGYTLVWTPERDAQMERVLPMTEASFQTFGDTLPESAGPLSSVPREALLAGLAVRRPAFSRSGFYVDATGTVLTTTSTVAQCGRITIDEAYNARVIARDEAIGLALLEPETPLVPMAFAQFQDSATTLSLGSEITIAGFSFEDVMTRPVLTFGRVDDHQGLEGEPEKLRLTASVSHGDFGGPVFGPNGAVIGLLSGQPQSDQRQLPVEVNFAVNSAAIREFLNRHDVPNATLREDVHIGPEQITRVAGDLTVLVSCWN